MLSFINVRKNIPQHRILTHKSPPITPYCIVVFKQKETRLASSITVDLYLFGLFLVCFKGYGITASVKNYAVHIFK